MKILHVNINDTSGGAARAAYRLHRSLLDAGIESQMLVESKLSDDFSVLGLDSKVQKGLAKARATLDAIPVSFYKNRNQTMFSPSWVPSGIPERINSLRPDIVHLHWICGGMMSIEEIAKIKAPIVWSLHDNWAFTGGCHVKWECQNYLDDCGKCPRLGSDKDHDLSRRVLNRKKSTFSGISQLTIVGPSRWISNCATESSLFKSRKVITIPIPLNTTVFSPVNKETARHILNLPKGKKLILFGAKSAVNDINKGFKELTEALNKLEGDSIELVVFGSREPKEAPNFNYKVHYLGHLHDDVSLKLLYSVADVMVVPSLQEAFGQTAVESMSCGTPVVAFGATGLLDIVDHRINGYLAQPYDTSDLAEGIEWVLSYPRYAELSENARKKVTESFDSRSVTQSYIQLYKQMFKPLGSQKIQEDLN